MRLRNMVAILAIVCTASQAQAVLTNLGDFSINSLRPSTDSYTGGGVTFIPANTDSIAQDTLVINWDVKDTVDTSKYNQVFQRITIPASGGTPTLLATATIRWDMLYDGTHQFGSTSIRPSDLVFDAASKKIVTTSGPADGGTRFFWFDPFAADTTVTTLGYSAKNGDNTVNMSKVILPTSDGKYTSFYPFSTNWVKAATDITAGNGAAVAKTNIAISSFAGWYPNTAGYVYTVDGFECEGGAAYNNSLLLLRGYKNSANGNALESHLYQVGSALDAAAINGYTDLGNMTPVNSTYSALSAFGMTLNGSNAFVRYGSNNDLSVSNRILMLSVPEPITLALLALSGVALLRHRRA